MAQPKIETIRRNLVLKELECKETPEGKQMVFSIKFVKKDGELVFMRRYMEKAIRDYLKLGVAFVEFLFNADGSQIVGVNAINSKYCRLTVANKDGVVENCIVSGRWPDTPSEGEYTVYDLLDEYDPFADLERRRWAGQTTGKSFVMCIRDS